MRWNELPRSDNVEDRRGGGGLGGMPMGRAGGMGIGTLLVICLIGWALGINPLDMIQGQIGSGSSDTQQQSQPAPGREAHAPSDQMGQFVSAVLGSTEDTWKKIFAAAGKKYEGHVFQRHALGLRLRPGGDGALLLPERPEGLSRHLFLPGP
jgi:predicted metalloprotease